MNTTNETSKLTSLTTTMAPTTTFSKSTKKGLAVLVALCMLSFYTGHLSRGGEQLSNVSLLRNGVSESGGVTTTNGMATTPLPGQRLSDPQHAIRVTGKNPYPSKKDWMKLWDTMWSF